MYNLQVWPIRYPIIRNFILSLELFIESVWFEINGGLDTDLNKFGENLSFCISKPQKRAHKCVISVSAKQKRTCLVESLITQNIDKTKVNCAKLLCCVKISRLVRKTMLSFCFEKGLRS